MFAFERSAIAVLAPLALLAIAVAASNMSDDSAPQQARAIEQPERLRDSDSDSERKVVVVAHYDASTTRH